MLILKHFLKKKKKTKKIEKLFAEEKMTAKFKENGIFGVPKL